MRTRMTEGPLLGGRPRRRSDRRRPAVVDLPAVMPFRQAIGADDEAPAVPAGRAGGGGGAR